MGADARTWRERGEYCTSQGGREKGNVWCGAARRFENKQRASDDAIGAATRLSRRSVRFFGLWQARAARALLVYKTARYDTPPRRLTRKKERRGEQSEEEMDCCAAFSFFSRAARWGCAPRASRSLLLVSSSLLSTLVNVGSETLLQREREWRESERRKNVREEETQPDNGVSPSSLFRCCTYHRQGKGDQVPQLVDNAAAEEPQQQPRQPRVGRAGGEQGGVGREEEGKKKKRGEARNGAFPSSVPLFLHLGKEACKQ